MANIELVIKISEDSYKATCNGYMLPSDVENIVQGIKNGIPLPKGHGRLIDADKLWDSYHDLGYDFYEAFDLADTIIEADTESENKGAIQND